jgi:diguanylate cyclase (GGDEF)-like protein
MRQRTLEHVRDSETLSISPPLLLHIGNGDRRGFWAGLPVYAQGLPRNLLGIVQGVFQIGVMVDTILAGVKLPLRIHLFAPGAATDDAPVYSGSRFGVGSIKPKSQAELAAVLHRTLPLDFGDKRWTLVVEPEPLAAPAGNPPSSIILVCGLLLSGGLTSFMWATQRYAGNLELANAHAARQNLRFDAALNNMGQGLLMYDPEGRLIVSNRRVAELLGMRWEEWESAALGATVPRTMQIIHDLTNVTVRNRPQLIGELRDILSRQGTGSIVFERTDGRAFCATCTSMADGGFVVTLEDVTEQRLSEQKIKYLAHYDPLTDLPNRALFHERLAEFLPQARHKPFAVFILDLDRFKNVNDTLGHPSGDKVLSAVAERMRGCTRGTDLVARLGGDEFAVVTFNPPADTALLATRLIDAVKAPYRLDGRQVVVGTSIGIAVAPSDGTDADQLMKNADLALYSSKADGGCSYRFFDPRLNPIGKRVKPPDPPPLHRAPETRPA